MAKKANAGAKKTGAARRKAAAPFRFLEHTADIMLEADGADYVDALQNAALGMFSVLGKAEAKTSFSVSERAANREELVVYILANILAECDAREIVPCKTEVDLFDAKANRISMRVWGEKKRPRDSIKAVTFHELYVGEGKNGRFTIRVLFDV